MTRKQKKTPIEDPRRNQIAPNPADEAVIPAAWSQNHSSTAESALVECSLPIQETAPIGARAAAEAREWLGTPYHHQASVKGIGCDCLGLLRGVYRAIVGPEPVKMPNYSPAWDEVAKRDDMLAAFQSYLVAGDFGGRPADRAAEFAPGDVLLFRMRRGAVAKHCGIVVEPGRFVHSHTGRGTVEIELSDWWRDRIAGLFTFPEPSANVRKV